jgi:hypothetical protein
MFSWECWQYFGNILATFWQHDSNMLKCPQFWVDMGVGADTIITPAQEFCVRNHQQIVDTVVHKDTVIHTYCSTYLPLTGGGNSTIPP